MGGGRTDDPRVPYPKDVEGPVAKMFHPIYKDRLSMFDDNGQYSQNNIRPHLYRATVSGSPHIKLSVYSPPDLSRPTFKDATSHNFKSTDVGESFGPSWSTHWFEVQLTVPENLLDHEHLEFHWNANNEGLVWSESGEPLQGLTGGGDREEWILPKDFCDGKKHTFYIEMACNGMFGNPPGGDIIQPPPPDKYFTLEKAEIVSVNLEARALFIDFWEIKDAAREFPETSWQQHEALQVCTDIMDNLGNPSIDPIKWGRQKAKEYLGHLIDSDRVYKKDTASSVGPASQRKTNATVYAIGHCHIDTCWLWPWAETKRKIARSWSNQCDLIDRYPEHRFCCSQAQQFKWLEMYYPTLFDRVKKKVKEGTFQPIGGSWVEHDTNMPSGESLVRQFLYGQRYFESRFGDRCKTFWLPDTFGYSPQLPQICRLAGMQRFFTQKLSWNNINPFPHTTFNWVALDGTQVLCHMAPSETYTAEADFGDVKRSMSQHKSKDQDPSSLLVFGKGDGGGGPTWYHLEKLRRCRGMSDTVGLLPRVHMGASVDDFFSQLEERAFENDTKLVTWYGELYFELHRGTYTTQANNKLYNRKAEIMLHDVEFLATMASVKEKIDGSHSSYKYPKRQIDEMWENVLLCQFHDCLPGSSIEMCYRDSDELYKDLFLKGEKLIWEALNSLGFLDPAAQNNDIGHPVVLNTLPWARSEIIPLAQSHNLGDASSAIVGGGPGLSWLGVLSPKDGPEAFIAQIDEDTIQMSNDNLIVTVEKGLVTSVYDKRAAREVVSGTDAGLGEWVLFDDMPLYWQAWDVEVYHLRTRQSLRHTNKAYIDKTGRHRVSVVVETRISDRSSIKTEISLAAAYADAPSLVEYTADISWHEDKKFLKAEFPVDVLSSVASYETQFGLIQRPTHFNTSWDMAKFEVCAHRFADLSEATYGVSVLNDSKYGASTHGRLMRLSVLRAPKAPDAHADMGVHRVRFAVLPHAGPCGALSVRAARAFNNPIIHTSAAATPPPPLFPFTSLRSYVFRHPAPDTAAALLGAICMTPASAPGIVLDTVKRAEDDAFADHDAAAAPQLARTAAPAATSIVVRLYDALGGRARGAVRFGALPVRRAVRCNVLEDDCGSGGGGGTPVAADVPLERGDDGGWFAVELNAFEVQSFRLVL